MQYSRTRGKPVVWASVTKEPAEPDVWAMGPLHSEKSILSPRGRLLGYLGTRRWAFYGVSAAARLFWQNGPRNIGTMDHFQFREMDEELIPQGKWLHIFEDIQQFSAGGVLDSFVAEFVMEWEREWPEGTSRGCWVRAGGLRTVADLWRPSEDIQDAWIAVQQMAKRWRCDLRLSCELLAPHKNGIEKQWTAEFYCFGETIGDTAPVAICRAAVKAVGALRNDSQNTAT